MDVDFYQMLFFKSVEIFLFIVNRVDYINWYLKVKSQTSLVDQSVKNSPKYLPAM